MVARVCILLILCQARRIWWVLEQPVNSLLESHPLFQAMLGLRDMAVHKLTTHMLWFGAPSLKPTWLYSSFYDEELNLVLVCFVFSVCSKYSYDFLYLYLFQEMNMCLNIYWFYYIYLYVNMQVWVSLKDRDSL